MLSADKLNVDVLSRKPQFNSNLHQIEGLNRNGSALHAFNSSQSLSFIALIFAFFFIDFY